MFLRHLVAAGTGLHIQQLHRQQQQRVAQVSLDIIFNAAFYDPAEKLVQALTVPPAVHVGLAEPKILLGDDAAVERFVVNLRVPVVRAVYFDAGAG